MIYTSNFVVSCVLLTVTVLAYFRSIETSDRLFEVGRRFGYRPSPELFAAYDALPATSWLSVRVLLPTSIVALPCWLAPLIAGTSFHKILSIAALGVLIGPLALPSAISPTRQNTPDGKAFLARWLAAKVDIALKSGTAILIAALVSKIPGISWLSDQTSQLLLPVIANRAGSGLFQSVIEGGSFVAIMMVLIRWSQITAKGPITSVVFLMSFAFSWVGFQWFFNEHFMISDTSVGVFAYSFIAPIVISYIVDFIMFKLDR